MEQHVTPDLRLAEARIETARKLMADLIAAYNTHDLDRATALFAPDYVGDDVAQALPQHGRDGIGRVLSFYFLAVPDLRITMDDLIVQGDRAALAWTMNGTHRGTLLRIPASGRQVSVRGISTFTLRDGQIVRALYIWDLAGLLREIGLLPEL